MVTYQFHKNVKVEMSGINVGMKTILLLISGLSDEYDMTPFHWWRENQHYTEFS